MLRAMFGATTVLAACSPYAPDLGAAPFLCGVADPKCPDGYTCVATATRSVCTRGTADARGSGSGACAMPFSGVLATWSLAGAPGSQVSTPAASSAPGVMASVLARAPALTAAAGTGSINSSNWPTAAAADLTKYYTLSITPPAGCSIAASSLAIDLTSSGTGPTSASVGASADAFATATVVSTSAPSMPTLTATASGTLEIRTYGFAATATSGTMRIQNTVSVMGAVQ